MAKITIVGNVTGIFDEEKVGEHRKKTFTILESDGQYAQEYRIDVWNSRIDRLNNVFEDTGVTVECELKSRYWAKNGRDGHIMSLSLINITIISGRKPESRPAAQAPPPPPPEQKKEPTRVPTSEELDLPF